MHSNINLNLYIIVFNNVHKILFFGEYRIWPPFVLITISNEKF